MKEKIARILTTINTIFFGYAILVILIILLASNSPSDYAILPLLIEIILFPISFISYIAGIIISEDRMRKKNILFLVINLGLIFLFYFVMELAVG